MVLDRPEMCPRVAPAEAGRGVTMHGVRAAADAGPADLGDVGLVLAESFGAPCLAGTGARGRPASDGR